jgi:hypothetical protein
MKIINPDIFGSDTQLFVAKPDPKNLIVISIGQTYARGAILVESPASQF